MTRRVLLLAVLVLAAFPASADAHAILERTTPRQGSVAEHEPAAVAFFFNEPVEVELGAVRVFDSRGQEVQTGSVFRPGGQSDGVATHLDADLPDGTYTATYHVISADSHPVSGGFTFSIGKPTRGGGEAVSAVLGSGSAGKATSVAFWADRWLGFAALGIVVGAVLFLLCVWWHAFRRVMGPNDAWTEAAEAFAGRIRRLLRIGVAAGLATALLALPLEGAAAGQGSFWKALDPTVIGEVLKTRFGTFTGLLVVAWLVLGALVYLPPVRRLAPVLVPAELGATGVAPLPRPRPLVIAIAAVPLVYLVLAPALIGHASTQSPTAVLFPADVVHLVAMSLWFGGLATLVVALPAATRALDADDRTSLLTETVARFSPFALGAVIALAVTGVIQAIIEVGSFDALIHTAFGRAVLIKIGLLLVLIGFGAANRQRLIPALRRQVAARSTPGRAGVALRRNLRAESSLILVVLAVTAALVSYQPGSSVGSGPASGRTTIGPAVLEYVVDPAQVGPNQIHLYLFDADTGSQYDKARDVSVESTQADAGVGPIQDQVRKSGPGHYTAQGAQFGVPGTWTVTVTVRTSRFDESEAKFDVAIR